MPKISNKKRSVLLRNQKLHELLKQRRKPLVPIDQNVQLQYKTETNNDVEIKLQSQNEGNSGEDIMIKKTAISHQMQISVPLSLAEVNSDFEEVTQAEESFSEEVKISVPTSVPEVDTICAQGRETLSDEMKMFDQTLPPDIDTAVGEINQVKETLSEELNISYETAQELEGTPCGRRIIHVANFFGKLQEISNHLPGCSINDLKLVGEKQQGLISKFTFICAMCNLKFYIDNDAAHDNYLDLNSSAVAGTISTGCGQAQLEEFLSCVNLPIIYPKTYDEKHAIISKHWESVSLAAMREAADRERLIALAEGRVNKNGIPIIDVIADGCWSKRSYKKNYSALSGAATIIGKNTGEILYIGIKNKYCQICAQAERDKKQTKEHLCFKNYDGPSTGMESKIIVEGFKKSIELYNLIFGRLISDGDASTYSKILEARPYSDVTVEKVECRNHLLRNLCNKLQALVADTKFLVKFRKVITRKRILSTRAAICKIIKKHKDDSDIEVLFEALLLSHLHGFGNHSKCQPYFCNQIGVVDDVGNDFFLNSLWRRICLILQGVAAHARSLRHDVDSNAVENFHSVVAKFVGGKRVNFSKKNSYNTRVYAAVVAFNTGKSVSKLYKSISKGESPTGRIKRLEEKRIRKNIANKTYKKSRRSLTFGHAKTDKDYGQECLKADADGETFAILKKNFLASLNKTDEEIHKIQKATVLQSQSSEWLEMRRSLLTASNFAKIIKRRPDTSCANTVKELLYKTNALEHVVSLKHGRQNEKRALEQLATQESITITPCGLFLDKNLPFLGATPDALIGEDAIIELKCPITAYNLGIEEAIRTRKVSFWKINKNGSLSINTTHNWYYQVQGQLHITQRQKCVFAVWFSEHEPLKVEIIFKDDNFWKSIEPKLTKFYMECILPELIDPRHPRSMPIRDPIYIQQAIKHKEQQRKLKEEMKK